MICCSIYNISCLQSEDIDIIRSKIQHHFTEKVNLKKAESVVSKAMLCLLLKQRFGLEDFLVDCDEKGKPYIVGSEIGFNISHSDDMVMCVCSDSNVGCDIQQIKPYNEKVAKRFFSPSEIELLDKCDDKARVFTVLWCLKESALKYTGEGITGGLDRYAFSAYYNKNSFNMYNMSFCVFELTDYIYAFCYSSSQKSFCENNVEVINLNSYMKGEFYEHN